MVLVIYLVLAVALIVVKVVAKPLLLLQKKPPPERDKSPGPPKLAIKIYLARVISLVRPPTIPTQPVRTLCALYTFVQTKQIGLLRLDPVSLDPLRLEPFYLGLVRLDLVCLDPVHPETEKIGKTIKAVYIPFSIPSIQTYKNLFFCERQAR